MSRLGSTMVEQIMSSGNSARVAGLLGLGNQVTTNSSACNTGTEAVVDAFLRIREGRAERMLAGGSEGHSQVHLGGLRRDEGAQPHPERRRPHEASRPMSASAAGFVPGSGAGVLLLESLDERQGARRAHLRRGARRATSTAAATAWAGA